MAVKEYEFDFEVRLFEIGWTEARFSFAVLNLSINTWKQLPLFRLVYRLSGIYPDFYIQFLFWFVWQLPVAGKYAWRGRLGRILTYRRAFGRPMK